MDLTWNLDTLYTSFNSEKFKGDVELLNQYIANLNKWAEKNLKDRSNATFKIEEFLKLYNEYKSLYSCLDCYSYLILSADSSNIEAMDVLDDIEDRDSSVIETFVSFNNWLKYFNNIDELIDASPYLIEHRFYIKDLLLQSKYLLSEGEEVLMAKMQNTGSKAWQRLYMELTSTIQMDIDIEGELKKVSLSELRNMAYEKSESLRKATYYAEADACKSISQASAACLNGIIGEALTIYDRRGYKSPLEKVLMLSKMDHETLNAMVSAIKESLPILHKYYHKKAEILGHKVSLPFYDIFAPVGDANTKISYLDTRDLIVSSFKTFSEELADFAKKVFDNKWIDAEPRTGKGNYGQCVDIFPIRESRIMANFTGNFSDVGVLAHEIGHAYHSYCLRNEKILNTDYPTPIAETAAIFCEIIVNNALLNIMPTNEGLSILEKSISDVGYYIVDFYGRYLFENKLFERRKSGQLSVEELNELMLSCMVEAYGDSIDVETIHPYMWMNKAGYYMAGNEFLNFPYSFGVLFSKGVYSEYMKKGEAFVEQYNIFLSATSKNNIVGIAKIIDIDVHSIDFWRNALNLIQKDIEEFINRA
ncbi:M3 family oligoendopeptidase [Clostridium tagluense]|uniref:M3 family oligoendopeptidase n=1 Tax=Clostridium tagluense TaxID=360422 RepID=UPI001C0C0E27|nr:M3 family oligoendopeptidase [Clostridium tagluense]MBU3128670.1 M3 family oligoendopeptidase [Clostridium tagluense]MCB2312786.1 M3 family oligoendopeptidase [Clostridium tagluense]MCB2317552.1 M3 family oligoendopeptidase [Clostridium tagluense]MCB2322358.1 M3 family oligoendopeptidase [Clostridium tagluense]MCB2327361.1 M3 family oligoendopeptidase [Clostridium tagluense]